MANLLSLIVRIGADNRELTRTLKQSERNIQSMTRSISNIGKAIGGAFAVGQIVQFGRASVREFAAAEAAMARLGGSVRNAGGNFDRVRGQVEDLVGSLEDMSTFGDDELVAALQTVVRITNDVNGSMREMQTVVDLAAGAQIELETAAQLVGKAYIGNTATLSRYGIVIKEGADAMQQLRDRFKGMAQSEANTLEGRIKQLNTAWFNFKEELGGIIIGGDSAGQTITTLRDHIKSLTDWLAAHKGEIAQFRSDLVEIARIAKEPIKITLEFVGDSLGELARTLREGREFMEMSRARSAARLNTGKGDVFAGVGAGRSWSVPTSGGGGGGGGGDDPVQEELDRLGRSFDEKFARMLRDRGNSFFGSVMPGLGESAGTRPAPTAPGMVQNQSASGALVLPGISTGGGGGGGILNSLMGAAGGGLSAMFSGLMASLGPMTLAFEFLSSMFEAAGPAIQVLLMPVKMLGQLVGGVVNKALSYLAQGIGMVIKAIGWLIDKINIFGGDGGIQKFGQEMIDAAKAAREGTKAQENLTSAINETVLNVPRILNLARLRFNGGAGGSGGSSGGSGGGGPLDVPTNRPPIGRGPSTGGGGRPVETASVVIENVYVQASNLGQLLDELGREAENKLRNGGISRLSLARV